MEPIIISAVAQMKSEAELCKIIATELNRSDPDDEESKRILEENSEIIEFEGD